MSQKNKLDFSEFFSSPSIEEWKKKILDELGNPTDETLKWKYKNFEFNKVNYQIEKSTTGLNLEEYFKLKIPRHWYTREYISQNDVIISNRNALKALEEGADSVEFSCKGQFIINSLPQLLEGLPLSFSPVHFHIEENISAFAKALHFYNKEEIKGSLIHPSFQLEEKSIHYFTTIKELADSIVLLENFPGMRLISIQSQKLHEAGLSPEVEIAYSIGSFIDIIDELSKYNIGIKEIIARSEFSFSIGKSFFPEIAKLRAFRILLNEVLFSYGLNPQDFSIPIHCSTASHGFSEDINYNILHNTSEALSAIIGGCDSITILPFDIKSKESNSFSSRISRNISLIFKEESYLSAVVDPGAGSYLLENMTNQIAEKALTLLKEMENKGGLSNYLKA